MMPPTIIQGGMGIAVSGWRLARTVSTAGHLGVVSGTAIDAVMVRRLQLGDEGGHVRRALEHFPIPEIADRILGAYFVDGGKPARKPFKSKPVISLNPTRRMLELIIAANFAEVWLAKEGHSGPVGINLLEKIQMPALPSLYGAMLAGVDYVLMGAGIPRAIPAVLDHLAALEPVSYRLDVTGTPSGTEFEFGFDPRAFRPPGLEALPRPKFLAIVSSSVLAVSLAKKATGHVDGFVVEAPTAGGHNAPPRGPLNLNEEGEPIYGPRDEPDFEQIRELGLPFWLAGSRGSAEGLRYALSIGAAGIQVGTAFAFCDESSMDAAIKRQVIQLVKSGRVRVFTDPLASPTGFPFKVLGFEGTISDPSVYALRERVCDLGYLRECYVREDGTVGYRCAAEPIEDFVGKGGDPAKCTGRKCICNALMGTIGLAQVRKDGSIEPSVITTGDEVTQIARFLKPGRDSYSAADVLEALCSPTCAHE